MSARRRWLAIAGTGAALLLFVLALRTHLGRACVEMDTPYLPLCPPIPADRDTLRQDLRERLARNPGDSPAWVWLLVSEGLAKGDAVLPGAVLVAPNNHIVARWRAAQALREGRVEEGVALLVQILRHQDSPDSARALAQIAATPEGLALLRPHLPTASEWLPAVLLQATVPRKRPPGDMLALVAAALDQGTLSEGARQRYMRSLKEAGQWLDAYGLWVAQHKDTVPLLYNAAFDQPFEPDGFDWEFANPPRSRAGALVEQVSAARRGLVLGVEFTGRSFRPPIVRQYLFTSPGSYRLRGEFMASKLRTEEGLAWTVQCTAGAKPVVGRSPALRDSGGVWRTLEFEFAVPADCGAVTLLQLGPAATYEATAGIKGYLAFDAFSLARMPASP